METPFALKKLPFAHPHTVLVDDILYVILPLYNTQRYKRRYELFDEFIHRAHLLCQHDSHVKFVVVEAAFQERDYYTHGRETIYPEIKWIRVTSKDELWLKESLINLGVASLPEDWNYVAWIDTDISFVRHDWPMETLHKLQHYDFVQMWHTCADLGPTGHIIKVDTSFAYLHGLDLSSALASQKELKYTFRHPGYAWSCRRSAFERIQGLPDYAILGSGDHHLACALAQVIEKSVPPNIHKNYRRRLEELHAHCKPLTLGHVDGTIQHHWHGKKANRQYNERWQVLTRYQYDPDTFIRKNWQGLVQWTSMAPKALKEAVRKYLASRNEDSIDM